VESEVGIESLRNIFGSSVNIDDSPSLVRSVSSFPYNKLLSFSILVDVDDLLVVDIDEVFFLESELLPPASVGFPNL
jgi:hypothetical protein